jgi:hypothetical protein
MFGHRRGDQFTHTPGRVEIKPRAVAQKCGGFLLSVDGVTRLQFELEQHGWRALPVALHR